MSVREEFPRFITIIHVNDELFFPQVMYRDFMARLVVSEWTGQTFIDVGRQIAAVNHKLQHPQRPRLHPLPLRVRVEWQTLLTDFKRKILHSELYLLCSLCGEPWSPEGAELMRCSICKTGVYCSASCQQSYVDSESC